MVGSAPHEDSNTDDSSATPEPEGSASDAHRDGATGGLRQLDATAAPADVQATFCATLVDEWSKLGLRHAVVAPGSRSTPMAVALAARAEFEIHVVHDERVAAFVALGLGVDGIPALLLCTSGTAAANFFPAVVEAGLSDIPMIVLTADRPPELRGVGAPQTIDQLDLYGAHVRWFHDADVADADDARTWRPLARTAHAAAHAGPVQLNLAFREPLLGSTFALPDADEHHGADLVGGADGSSSAGRSGGVDRFDSQPHLDDAVPKAFAVAERAARGVILLGGRSGVEPSQVRALQEASGWPLLADPISQMRHLPGVVTMADSLLRDAHFAETQVPALVVRIGRPSTSKTLAQWVDRAVSDGATLVQVGGPGVIDPGHNVAARCAIDDLIATCRELPVSEVWAETWREANRRAEAAVASTLDDFAASGELTEPGVARTIADHLPADTSLVVSSSMPVRDHEWFGGGRATAHANRGANGIDGVMSSALGLAIGRGSAAVLIGDLAFVHDSNALLGLRQRAVDLRVVVVDNDGGGIFSFLPQATTLDRHEFEALFGTPHGTDVLTLAVAHGLEAVEITSLQQLAAQLVRPGPWVARVASDRERNVDVHALLHEAVATALAAPPIGDR